MSSLVQIIPPLSQSKVEVMKCPVSYRAIFIDGRKPAISMASGRGREVHHVAAAYIEHCALQQVSCDWAHLDVLAKPAGAESGGILDGFRDSYLVDWQRVYGTEITMMLDEDFQPTHTISDEHWSSHIPKRNLIPLTRDGGYCAHIGTADNVLLNEACTEAVIEDFKTHEGIFDADTHQGILYSFMLLKHLPSIRKVTFRLVFVRYARQVREVVYHREDMGKLQQTISRARERQKAIHVDPDNLEPAPTTQCSYCPLGVLTLDCPIKEQNPMVSVDPVERLKFKEWTRRMNADNTPIVKAHAEQRGGIEYRDGSGRLYVYANQPVPSTTFPLDRTTVKVLEGYKDASGEDLLDGRLNISSTKIKGLLKAKKRALLKDIFDESIIQTETKPKWAIRTPDEGLVEDFNPYGEE